MDFLKQCELSHKKMCPEWVGTRQSVTVPTWDEYFMTMAMLTATRSQDAQWQAGAVLVKDNRIIGSGYNSWPAGMQDSIIPNTRPHKYDWVIHAERNALANCVVENPAGATCYTNGWPCLECLKELVQRNILDFIITEGKATMLDAYTDNQKATYWEIVSRKQVSFKQIKLSDLTINKAQEILLKSNGV